MSGAGDDLVGAVVGVHERVIATQAELQRLSHDRDDAVRRALDAGVGATELSRAMGVSRQRVYQMAELKW